MSAAPLMANDREHKRCLLSKMSGGYWHILWSLLLKEIQLNEYDWKFSHFYSSCSGTALHVQTLLLQKDMVHTDLFWLLMVRTSVDLDSPRGKKKNPKDDTAT